MKRPAWAAAGTFQATLSAVESDLALLRRARFHQSAQLDRLSSTLSRCDESLRHARVIALPREQVESIPLGALESVQERFRHLTAPFPMTFVSLDNATGPTALEGRDAVDRTLGGVLFIELPSSALFLHPFAPISDRTAARYGRIQPTAYLLRSPEGEIEVRSSGTEATLRTADGEALGADEVMQLYATDRVNRALAVMEWLQSFNVELVEAPLSPRQRKRELKKGRQIALTVEVKQTKRYTSASQSNGSANYSHRFETRGHYKHYFEFKPDGQPSQVFERCYAKDPSRVVMVDGKECFRFWVPPYVKGPIDKPFVPKVRVVEDAA